MTDAPQPSPSPNSDGPAQGPWFSRPWILGGLLVAVSVATAGVTALLVNVSERKAEQSVPYVRVVEVGEDDTDPAKWGRNWPLQYDGYKRTALRTSTKYGGHLGSEAMPEERIERDPWLKRMFLGYAFAIDFRDRRGHAYMLQDQEQTKRLSKPQTGSCLHCHASILPLYRELGGGDAMKGFEQSYTFSYADLNKKLHDSGHGHPVSCVDCHNPQTMELRVTRPGFINGIRALAEGDAEVPALESIRIWRAGSRKTPYDPNKDASRGEMRSFVCGQCHVEYYCSSKMPLTFPWGDGLKIDQIESFWNETKFADGHRFYDYEHKETGAEILKAQHPEFETWNQGIHARAGVSCADCHMPYQREGATKVSDHWVRSPLLNVNRACQTCHRANEAEILARVDVIQERNHQLLERSGGAIVELIEDIVRAKQAGATPEQLAPALELQRKAQFRIDMVASENSMGFHAPQESAKVLGEALDFARQGQLAARQVTSGAPVPTPAAPAAPTGTAAPTTAAPAKPAPGAPTKPAAVAPTPAAPAAPAKP
ncbi:MAG TPA: ammonia-forming cytochrome c nitrite reductase subunit c552 [Polyangiaceae bacterium]|nr:ammonia-forming cytochrome c nitrite reductase subunit c552 [Polyangiaceae bacterium]